MTSLFKENNGSYVMTFVVMTPQMRVIAMIKVLSKNNLQLKIPSSLSAKLTTNLKLLKDWCQQCNLYSSTTRSVQIDVDFINVKDIFLNSG